MDGRAVAVRCGMHQTFQTTNRPLEGEKRGGKKEEEKRGTYCVSAWPKIKLCRHVSEKSLRCSSLLAHCTVFFSFLISWA